MTETGRSEEKRPKKSVMSARRPARKLTKNTTCWECGWNGNYTRNSPSAVHLGGNGHESLRDIGNGGSNRDRHR